MSSWASGELRPRNVIAISGMPAVGKTTLSLAVAQRLRSEWPDGEVAVDLRGTESLASDDEIATEILEGLAGSMRSSDARDRQHAVRQLLGQQRIIVLLDNAGSAEQVADIAAAATRGLVIVTSRNPLATLPDALRLSLDVLDDASGLELLDRLIGGNRVASEPTSAARVVGLCGALPLALRIAGARLATRPQWTLESYAERLADERRRLAHLSVEQLDVRASFNLSYPALDRR